MLYGICSLSVVAVRSSAGLDSAMISQFLYGEHFKVLEQRKHWSKVRSAFDNLEGWVLNHQIFSISQDQYEAISKIEDTKVVSDLVAFVSSKNSGLIPIVMGSTINDSSILDQDYEGNFVNFKSSKKDLIDTALQYINAPFLPGGRSPFGVDASGFTQLVYKINGHTLKRTAVEQSAQGEALSFIEESEPGDLAFFDNQEGVIDHVGIIMKDNYIIHVHGNTRIDRLDHTGIFNTESRNYTHSLRVIKKVI